tara:strand:+ start:496 stop:750 length:255 start_codon:yes stop_codon:yes gene_type:complete
MKTIEMQNKKGNTDFEPFYKVVEAQPHKLEEASEVLLEMVTSDPESTKNVAHLIKENYPDLYKAITALDETKDNGNLPSCCGGH